LTLLGILDALDRRGGGPAVVAVPGDVQAHDALVVHGHHVVVEQLAAGHELVQLVKGVDEKGQVDEAEARAQVGGGHRTDAHALDGAHLQLVEHLDLTAQHGKGLVVEGRSDPSVRFHSSSRMANRRRRL
jgi:hypothetical protein